ncbi:putative alpha-ketoglutarate-dependent dioxygenase [Morus notabilis]|uniref:Putative alpha-ketoglutarate-dependent dioxygenase n=1 Tax=Morus notabilis TaxID=981085 RepID=W9QT44_9ROSA|nr:putative alpha-ketoglutarate-dependent dioxygenase [Morus notabilis]
MLFADDIVLVDEHREGVNCKLELWRQTLEMKGFKLSRTKNEYMHCRFSNSSNQSDGISLDGVGIGASRKFRYLGSIVQHEGDIEEDIQHRIKAWWVKWKNATRVICDGKMPIKLKGKFYRTVIRPAMLYVPPWLMKVTQKINEETGLFPSPINHVLINEYLPNQGIMPHQDGPAYFPVVAILSLGSPVVMDFTPHSRLRACTSTLTEDAKEERFSYGNIENEKDKSSDNNNHHPFSVLLMPRSLLIFEDSAYSDYLHGIKDSVMHCFDGVVNEVEVLNQKEPDPELSRDLKSIQRTTNRISLTCRLVLKVHKNLFKF